MTGQLIETISKTSLGQGDYKLSKFYHGGADRNRKVLFLVNKDGVNVAVVKLAAREEYNEIIGREITYERKAKEELKSTKFGVPEIIGEGTLDGLRFCIEELIEGELVSVNKESYLQDVYELSRLLSFSHGDMTEMNIIKSGDMLYVMDWEEASDNRDSLSDFVHYFVRVFGINSEPDFEAKMKSWLGANKIDVSLEDLLASYKQYREVELARKAK